MSFEFDCKQCAARLSVPNATAGKQTKCPHCECLQTASPPQAEMVEPQPSLVSNVAPANAGSLPPGAANATVPSSYPTDAPANPYRDAPNTPNPYMASSIPSNALPQVIDEYELASRGTRFVGAILDWLFFLATILPGIVVTNVLDDSLPDISDLLGSAIMVVGGLLGQVYQWYQIAKNGQSIAKRMLGIRIATATGQPPGFLIGVALRTWTVSLFGFCYPLLFIHILFDSLFIFSHHRQCLHDLIASTYVVKVSAATRQDIASIPSAWQG